MAISLYPPAGDCFCRIQIFQVSSSASRRSSQAPANRRFFGFPEDFIRPSIRNRRKSSAFVSSSRKEMAKAGSPFRADAVEGNSASTTADADPASPPAEKPQEEENVVEYEEMESAGKAVSQTRQERVVSGVEERPSKTEEFWRGVWEEIQLVEWPPLQKVLSTTGVVTGIIVGSSLVLLTVNAVLARLSDSIFNNAPLS